MSSPGPGAAFGSVPVSHCTKPAPPQTSVLSVQCSVTGLAYHRYVFSTGNLIFDFDCVFPLALIENNSIFSSNEWQFGRWMAHTGLFSFFPIPFSPYHHPLVCLMKPRVSALHSRPQLRSSRCRRCAAPPLSLSPALPRSRTLEEPPPSPPRPGAFPPRPPAQPSPAPAPSPPAPAPARPPRLPIGPARSAAPPGRRPLRDAAPEAALPRGGGSGGGLKRARRWAARARSPGRRSMGSAVAHGGGAALRGGRRSCCGAEPR